MILQVVFSGQSRHARESVEAGIEAQDLLDPVLLHNCQMDSIAGGEATIAENDLLGALKSVSVDRQDFVHGLQDRVVSRLDVMVAIEGRIAMEDFLQHLGIGDQTPAFAD